MVSDEGPLSSHNCLPLKSYERIFRLPTVMISVRCAFSHTIGDDQLVRSSRSTRHTSAPVRASYDAMNDCSSLSLTTYTRPLWATGDAAEPQPSRVFSASIGFDQTGLPARSNANTPAAAK